MQKYGSDKPDLRIPIEIADVTDAFRGSGFKIFTGMIEKDERVRVYAIPAKTGGSRAFCDRMNSWAQKKASPVSDTFSSGMAKGRSDRQQYRCRADGKRAYAARTGR